MSSAVRTLVLSLAAVPVAVATASAQPAGAAPGACETCYSPAPVAAAPAPEVDTSRRWGVGLRMTSFAIANRADPEGEPDQLGGGGLQIRYRFARRWEAELGFDGLSHHHDDDGATRAENEGPELVSTSLAALYHFRPERRWDWYVLAGIGSIAPPDEDDGAQVRGAFHLGIGIERRWRKIGIGAELRAVGIAPVDGDEAAPATGTARVADPSTTTPAPPAEGRDEEGDSAGQFSIRATYYF
jgi:hypothetical protein